MTIRLNAQISRLLLIRCIQQFYMYKFHVIRCFVHLNSCPDNLTNIFVLYILNAIILKLN